MRFFNNRFPYTSANNINLDWIIKRVKALGNTVEGYSSDIETALTTAQTAQTTAESVSGIAQAAQTAAADALETAESASETAEGIAQGFGQEVAPLSRYIIFSLLALI